MAHLIDDLQLYRRLVGMQLRAQTQYKANLVIDIGTYLIVTGLEYISVLVVFGAFPSLLGWHVGEVSLLYSVTSICFGLAEMIGAGIDIFSDTIRRGEFDRVLLRPVGVLWQVIGSDFRLRRCGRITQGLLAWGLSLHLLPDLHWTLAKALVLVFGVVSGCTIFLSLLLVGATLCFWTVETTELINIFTYGGREMLSYPMTIYNQALQIAFFFVVPLAFGSYVPVCYVLDRTLPFGLPNAIGWMSPVVGGVFALIAGSLWRSGVRRYQSTGS